MKDIVDMRERKVASNIRKIREYRNYTQEYLAARLNISQNAYSKIELGYTKITVGRLFNIADVLDADPADIIATEDVGLLKMIPGNSASST
jgi:transcriptional regulator with XRE-family HTH domain